jgi:mRNA interferase MazF
MSPKRGDIVNVLFPFSDLNQVKLRPALIVQSDVLGANPDVIVACITGNLARRFGQARVFVSLSDPGNASCNLKSDSVLMLDKLATVDRRALQSVRGWFQRMDLIDSALRTALAV